MRNIPLFETFILVVIGLEAIMLVSFDIFTPRSDFYQLMAGIMPQGGWGLLCFLALFCQAIGLLGNIPIFRYVGLGISGVFFACLFFINTFEFPNLMSGITLSIAIFCFISWSFVRDTDLVRWDKKHVLGTDEDEA
ncbi:hypothetical protein ATL39_0910 [Sinobaca qinghaiensis]|uniref:DoxX-like protein n=1 Tax=Sinobaca qinghaiensis TaxID=342944 RepID=A0A419V5E7_9BACL|nr:hypothetical protein [Sinobaca qinghaiensis]RKD75212.1 hypothetical protein ATL39_0910 [Sinobaca qinghaiensis]